MNISVKDTSVFGVFHPDAQDLYNMCSDLKKVAWGLWNPNRRLGDEVWCPNPRSDTSLTVQRIKGCIFSELSRPCSADGLRNSRIASKRCKGKPFLLKRNSMESACNYISAVMNSFIVHGVYKFSDAPRVVNRVTGRAKITLTSTEVTRVQEA